MAGHDHALPGSAPLAESAAATRRATLYSVATAAVLIAMKLAAWLMSGSVAMLSSLADSGLDLVASLITFAAVRYAVVAPDEEHAFGHGKAEAFASLVQAALVFASAALVAQEAIGRLLHPQPVTNGLVAIDEIHVGFSGQQGAQALTRERLVIDDYHFEGHDGRD